MFGKLNTDQIEELLKHQFVGRIGCHADDITYVMPISYAYDGTYIYCHSFEGMKINIMRKNPKICFEVDNTQNLGDWQSVIGWGEFEELTDEEEKKPALQKLLDRALPIVTSETMHITPQWPFPVNNDTNLESSKGIVFRVKLTGKTGRFEKSTEQVFFAS